MILINKTKKILDSPWMSLFPSSDLTKDQLEKLDRFSQTEFILENFSDHSMMDFFRETVDLLLPSYDIFLVFVESSPQKKWSIRSHKLMFYDVRHAIEKEDRYEVEVDMAGGESLIAGLVKLNPDNIDYSIQHIINSNLRFVYIVKRDSKYAPANWTEFLRQIVDCRLPEERQTFLHIPKVIANHADEDRSLMNLTINGRDDEIIQFWVLDPELRKMLSELETRYRSQVEN